MNLYYNPDGELTRDNWDPRVDSKFSLIICAIIVIILTTFEIIGIITVVKWII